jgi:DNA polymerase-3 subunit delta
VSPITVLRGLQRHFLRLHLVAGLVAQGRSVDQAMAALKPPPHFRLAGRMRGQLARWPAERIGMALDVLLTAEMDGKTTGSPAAEFCGRAVMQLTRAAGRRK